MLRYLVEKGGIDSARISSVGYGDTKPVVSNATEAGRQKNRRVDIVLYSPEPAQAPSEQAMKPAEPVDDGYRVSGIGADGPSASGPAADSGVPTDPAKMENPAAVPTEAVPDAIPAAGDQSVPGPIDQPLAPPQ